MGNYDWPGMRILKLKEVTKLYHLKQLDGKFLLYQDGTEAEIRGISLGEIYTYYIRGGEFGEEIIH